METNGPQDIESIIRREISSWGARVCCVFGLFCAVLIMFMAYTPFRSNANMIQQNAKQLSVLSQDISELNYAMSELSDRIELLIANKEEEQNSPSLP